MSQPSAPPPHVVVLQMLSGKWLAAAIGAAARFGVADHLHGGPKSAKELAGLTGTKEDALYRLLRATASVGIFSETADGRFAQTDLSSTLRSDARPGLRNMAMMMHDDWHIRCWAELPWSVQTGQSAALKVYGKPMWEEFQAIPEQALNFNNAMTDISAGDGPLVVGHYDFSKLEHIVDIGGGLGLLLASILAANVRLRGTLYEIPGVIEQARKSPILAPFAGRVEFVAGSFFDSVPAGPDAYIMKHIIHDWDDEHSRRILGNCREAIRPGAKLLVVDAVVEGQNQPSLAKILDLEMLVCPGGLERTEQQWVRLFSDSGFRLERVIRTPGPATIIEGVPV